MKKLILAIWLTTNIAYATPKLSWETKNPKNSEWTAITLAAVEKRFEQLDKAGDVETFCPNYKGLTKEQKINAWGEIFSGISFVESGWRTIAELTELSLGTDSVTNLPVVSSGLLQLSYGDTKWAKWCDFRWDEDKKNGFENPTILRAKNNLECGIGIMANQIDKRNNIVLKKGAYWSVLREGGKYCKVSKIAGMVQKSFPACVK